MTVKMNSLRTIAYFSMEVALEDRIPTYSGGLGVLAGDFLRSAADLALPMVGVTLLHRKGYFRQRFDEMGHQREEAEAWPIDDVLQPLNPTGSVEVEGRQVTVRAWRYLITGISGGVVPVILLDTDVTANDPFDRGLTDHLYGGDARYRLCQEVILGIGGVRMLRALGYTDLARCHMNEGHSALLALELFAEELKAASGHREEAIDGVKRKCVFTTHTPVPAGHDIFPASMATHILGPARWEVLEGLGCCSSVLNMTFVGLHLSHYVNGVTKRHREVTRSMFPDHPVGSITNGVHSATWTLQPFHTLYDKYMPDWQQDSFSLRHAMSIPLYLIRQAHYQVKARLIQEINRRVDAGFHERVFTMGFARRATAYKRPHLLLQDLERLGRIAAQFGPLQIVFAGKAHPKDEEGKALIRKIIECSKALPPTVKLAYLPNYGLELGALCTAGVDLWLNTPKPPHEASGTSGMKAAHNGVPSLSVLDGWWLEGHVEGVTGWAIGSHDNNGATGSRDDKEDARELYDVLEGSILPMYHGDSKRWAELMRSTIALNASMFNTQRMVQEYVTQAYVDR